MKKTLLLLMLCLCLLLCACRTQTIAKDAAVQISPSPQALAPQASAAPATASPAPTPAETAAEEPTPSPAAELPLDLQKAQPLLLAVAETLVVDGDMAFSRYPDADLTDAVLARLVRDMGADERYRPLHLDSRMASSIDGEHLKLLYADCFSEGEFPGFAENGYGEKKNDGGAVYERPDRQDLQFSVPLYGWHALREEGYFELSFGIAWAYPEDAQATDGGGFTCWVKKNDDSPFGLGLALLQPHVTLRPGEDFGSHPARDTQQIMPMLHALAKACLVTGDGFTQKPSDTFAFEAAYALLNTYGGDFGLDASASKVKVSKQTMDEAMAALFGPEYKMPSSLPAALRGRLQASGSGYILTHEQEETTPIFVEYAVASGATEQITVSLRTGDKTDESPWQFHGSARVALDVAEGLPYRNRYARDVYFTPERNT